MLPSPKHTSLESLIEQAAERGAEKALAPILKRLKRLEEEGPLTLTVAQACELAGGNISDPTARQLIARGDWIAAPLNEGVEGGKLLVDRDSVIAWKNRIMAKDKS